MTETIPTHRALEILTMTANGDIDRDSPTMGPRPARAVLDELNRTKAELARTRLQLQLARIHPNARQVADDEIELWVAGAPELDGPDLASQVAAEARRARAEGGDARQDAPGASEELWVADSHGAFLRQPGATS